MALWTRVSNVFRTEQLNRELNEEFESHIEEAIAEGRDPLEVRRSFGSMLRQREASRRVRVAGWLDGLRADVMFGWRQLRRNRVTSAAAILSLALAMGGCVGAFRLIDALLLRPLPVDAPERLYAISYDGVGVQGKPNRFDSGSYPMFQKMRAVAKDDAELIAVSYVVRTDLTYASDAEMEKAHWQLVSGWMFNEFGLRPAIGRLLRKEDDLEPGKHPVAVISYDYWKRRFGRDPNVVGRTFRQGKDVYEIVGVVAKGFTGTRPGTMTDIFVPTTMRPDWIRNASCLAADVCAGEAGSSARTTAIQIAGALRGDGVGEGEGMDQLFQGTHGVNSKNEAHAGDSGRGCLGYAERLWQRPDDPWSAGAAGVADCLCKRGQPDDSVGSGANTRDGAASFDWRGALAARADGARGERHAVRAGRHDWRVVRVVVGSAGGKDDQSCK